MAVATVNDVKAALQIPAANTSLDAYLASFVAAAIAVALEIGRYSENAVASQVDVFQKIRVGVPFRTKLRPVSALTLGEARMIGGAFSEVTPDLLDAAEGQVVILGGSDEFPPSEVSPSKNRNRVWDVIRLTYAVGAMPASDRFKSAVVALAIYWWQRDGAGADVNRREGPVSVQYTSDGVPPWIMTRLAPAKKGQRARAA